MGCRLGVDVGGTFTDLALFDEDTRSIHLAKVPTNPENQALGVLEGIERITREAGVSPDSIRFFVHGTTVATNAILEGKGAHTALLVTKGFRDVLFIKRQDRPKLYDFFARRPDSVVPRSLVFEIAERTLFTGEISRTVGQRGLKRIFGELKRRPVESLAICLLHSYANPSHEQEIRQAIVRECPGLDISLSSEVIPEMGEYERMSTTVLNAYVSPVVGKYVGELESRVAEAGARSAVYVMQSNGGLLPVSAVQRKSVSTILSGPAAGVIGGMALAKQAGYQNLITIDMGGTSFDVCLIYQGEVKLTWESEIGGHALKSPMIDMHTLGAGGGSIAWIDPGGALRVGPQSAGAVPGPVCYRRGGTRPTVTDANLVLGRLNPDYFLGGEIRVDKEAAYQAIEKEIAQPLGMSVPEVAEGIIRVVNASMAKGLRFVSVEKGYHPSEFSLVCFGGNGPLHAAELAEDLGIPEIVIPPAPGVNCAYGLLVADLRYDYVRPHLARLDLLDLDSVRTIFGSMETDARGRMEKDGLAPGQVLLSRTLNLRYLGQGYSLEAPLASGKLTRASLEAAARRFHALHKRRYGFSQPQEPIEVVNLRLACLGVLPKLALKKHPLNLEDSRPTLKEERMVFLRGQFQMTGIYDRERLLPGMVARGPAVIEQMDSTTLLFPGQVAQTDEYRNLIIKVGPTA